MRGSPEQWLGRLLRLAGAVCLLALIPWLMPRDWIAHTHKVIGLGTFPQEPIAEYLARFSSALCAFYGGLLVLLSNDVYRFARIITYQAVAIMLLSSLGIVLGSAAGMPLGWMTADAVACWCYCLPTLWLQHRIAVSRPA